MSSTDSDQDPESDPGQEIEPADELAGSVAPRSLKNIAAEFFRPKPAAPGSRLSSRVVNGLDRRELTMAMITVAFDLFFVLVYWQSLRHSTTKIDRADAPDFLIAGIVAITLVMSGVLFRRRALLGFAAFLAGLDFLTYRLLFPFVLNAGIGSWLLYRVSQTRATRTFSGTRGASRASRSSSSARSGPSRPAGGRPAPSKRYTPPRKRPGSPKR